MVASGQHGAEFVDRGNRGASDISFATLTKDGAWHELDLSAIVGTGRKALLVAGNMNDVGAGGLVQLKDNGFGDDSNSLYIRTQVAGQLMGWNGIVTCDVSGKIAYKITQVMLLAGTLIVRGWFEPIA